MRRVAAASAALRSDVLLASRREAAAVSAAAAAACAELVVVATAPPAAAVWVDAAAVWVVALAAARVRDARLFDPLVAAGVPLDRAEDPDDVVTRLADGALAFALPPPFVVFAVVVAGAVRRRGAGRWDFVVPAAPESFADLPDPFADLGVAGRVAGAGAGAAAAGAGAAAGAFATCPGADSRPLPGLSAGGAASAGPTARAATKVAHTSSSAMLRRDGLVFMTSRDPVEHA